MGSCSKCGKKQLYPVVGNLSGGTGGTSEATALIQMRYTVTININGVPTNLYASSVSHVPFSVIDSLATYDPQCFMFRRETEKVLFKIAYPQHGGL